MNDDKLIPEFAPLLLGKVGLSPHDAIAEKELPTLMELLMPRFRSDKRMTREAGSLLVKVQGSLFTVTLTCPTEGVETTMVTSSVMGLLDQLELHTSDPGVAWTPTYAAKKKSRRGLV